MWTLETFSPRSPLYNSIYAKHETKRTHHQAVVSPYDSDGVPPFEQCISSKRQTNALPWQTPWYHFHTIFWNVLLLDPATLARLASLHRTIQGRASKARILTFEMTSVIGKKFQEETPENQGFTIENNAILMVCLFVCECACLGLFYVCDVCGSAGLLRPQHKRDTSIAINEKLYESGDLLGRIRVHEGLQ